MDDIERRNALRTGSLLVAEVTASQPDRRAWVAVYPQRDDADRLAQRDHWRRSTPTREFNVFHREFSRSRIERDQCIGPNDGMWDLAQIQCVDEEELLEALDRLDTPFAALEYVHHTDYPV